MPKQRVVIDRVITDCDMRVTKGLVDKYWNRHFKSLRFGHGILMINRTGTIVQMIDSTGMLHRDWVREGEVPYHVDGIVEMFSDQLSSIGLSVFRGRSINVGRAAGLSLPSKKKAA